jgi:AcrR family transcriptional regulator
MLQPAERADARANRARLIAAARAVFRERGPDAEMKEIAERAGLGVGTIYRNFPTKDDLIVALVTEMVSEIRAVIEAAALIDDPIAAVRHLLRGGFDVVERHGDLMMMMLSGRLPPGCEEQFAPLGGLVEALIQTGIDGRRFRPDIDVGIVVAQIRTAFTPWSYSDLRRTRTPDEIADAYLDLILRGITSPPDSLSPLRAERGSPE